MDGGWTWVGKRNPFPNDVPLAGCGLELERVGECGRGVTSGAGCYASGGDLGRRGRCGARSRCRKFDLFQDRLEVGAASHPTSFAEGQRGLSTVIAMRAAASLGRPAGASGADQAANQRRRSRPSQASNQGGLYGNNSLMGTGSDQAAISCSRTSTRMATTKGISRPAQTTRSSITTARAATSNHIRDWAQIATLLTLKRTVARAADARAAQLRHAVP